MTEMVVFYSKHVHKCCLRSYSTLINCGSCRRQVVDSLLFSLMLLWWSPHSPWEVHIYLFLK